MTAPTAFPLEPALEFMRILWRVNHAVERVSAQMEKELGVTAQQRLLLRCVGTFPGITPGQVARVLHIDPGTVSATVRRLESKRLIARRKDPANGRRVTLGLTRKGRGLDVPSERTIESAAKQLLALASAADVAVTASMLTSFARLLERIELSE